MGWSFKRGVSGMNFGVGIIVKDDNKGGFWIYIGLVIVVISLHFTRSVEKHSSFMY